MITDRSFNSNLPGDESRNSSMRGVLSLINEFGFATENFFERIYRGLSRKRNIIGKPGTSPEPDQIAALRQANRELTIKMRDAQNIASRLQAVFASISEGVVVQDTEGRIVLFNEAAYSLIGTMKTFWESELGRLFEAAKSANNRKPESELEPVGSPLRIQVNNRILGAQLALVATPDGSPLGSLIVLRDVTKEALADRLKDEFITQITHELRTPLTVIKGMSEVLINQPADRPPSRKFLEAIGRNAAILDRMIVELLDISEISAGSFSVHRQELSLDELVWDVINGQEPRLKKAGLNIGVMVADPFQTKIVADDRRLRWAIGHLLDNSINYTLKGGFIQVRIGKVKAERITIDVIDNGVGINDKDLPHVFDRFYRGAARTPDSKTIDPRGLGQGLYIARAVAEAHGGYVSVSSTPGQGSKFTLAIATTMPELAPESSPESVSGTEQSQSTEPPSISSTTPINEP